jgi:hypothetical protein
LVSPFSQVDFLGLALFRGEERHHLGTVHPNQEKSEFCVESFEDTVSGKMA